MINMDNSLTHYQFEKARKVSKISQVILHEALAA